MLLFIACATGIYLGLYFNILSLLPFFALGASTYVFSFWIWGQSTFGSGNLLIFFISIQAGYMLGLTARETYGQVLARLNVSPSKRV
jgi:hypothetical protein